MSAYRKVAAVTWGFHAEALLRENGADHVVTDPRQLLDLVPQPVAARIIPA